jgi:hypothetical protein
VIKKTFSLNSKVGIIGDCGTPLDDCALLFKNIIEVDKVDIIIHLGDVYYAGNP